MARDPSERVTASGKRRAYIKGGLDDIEQGNLGWDEATRRQLESQAKQAAMQTTPAEEIRRQGLGAGTALAQGGATEAVAAATTAAGEAAAGVTPELAAAEMAMAQQQQSRIEEMMMQPTFWEQMAKTSAGKEGGALSALGGTAADALMKTFFPV